VPATPARSPDLLAFGQAVRRRRLELELTFDALAAEAKISRGMLIAIEHGTRNPGLLSVFRLASALKVTAAELIAEATIEPEP
jgi:transcriptional regulator with XRE-family HTH domain